MQVNNHNCKVINIIEINNNYQLKSSSYGTHINMSGGSEQAITHIRECHGHLNQYTTLQRKTLPTRYTHVREHSTYANLLQQHHRVNPGSTSP
jgi:hypothetical protein